MQIEKVLNIPTDSILRELNLAVESGNERRVEQIERDGLLRVIEGSREHAGHSVVLENDWIQFARAGWRYFHDFGRCAIIFPVGKEIQSLMFVGDGSPELDRMGAWGAREVGRVLSGYDPEREVVIYANTEERQRATVYVVSGDPPPPQAFAASTN